MGIGITGFGVGGVAGGVVARRRAEKQEGRED
jgi:hypothetical protein